MVRRRRAQRRLQLPRPARRGRQRRPRRAAVGGRARRRATRHLRRAHRRGQARRERARGARHRPGRPRRDLHADDPRGDRRDAGRRAHRRDPLRRVRRLLGRQPSLAHRRRRREARDHRRRRLPQGQGVAAQARRRPGARRPQRLGRAGDGRARARRAARRERRRMDRRPRPVVARRRARGIRRARGEGVPRREPAVHPLYVRHHRKAEGHPAHLGRLPHPGGVHEQGRARHPSRVRRVLVHGRHRLGHRAQLRHVRSARQRRDAGAVRGHARHAAPGPLVGDRREVRRHDPLHGADRHPLVHEARPSDPEEVRPVVAAAARLGGRAHQPRGVDVVPQDHRRQDRADRRHVVADRDRARS